MYSVGFIWLSFAAPIATLHNTYQTADAIVDLGEFFVKCATMVVSCHQKRSFVSVKVCGKHKLCEIFAKLSWPPQLPDDQTRDDSTFEQQGRSFLKAVSHGPISN